MDTKITVHGNGNCLAGSEGEIWVNPRTGEERYFQSIQKTYYGRKNFWKLYLQDFLAVLGILESKQLDVICYIMEQCRNYKCFFFFFCKL